MTLTMTRIKVTSLLAFAIPAIAILAMAPGCGDDGGGGGLKLGIQLYGPPAGYPDPFENVAFLRVIATGDFGTRDTFMEYSAGMGELPKVPFGKNIQVTVEGVEQVCLPRAGVDPSTCQQTGACDSAEIACDWGPGGVISRGRTVPRDISRSSEPQALAVYMLKKESYGPTTSAALGAPTQLATGRVGHTVTQLEDGTVLIVGGATLVDGTGDFTDPSRIGSIFRTAEIFDPQTGDFVPVSTTSDETKLFSPRAFHTAVRLPNPDGPDRVAFFGGYSRVNDELVPISTVEIYDPTTHTFIHDGVPPMLAPRAFNTATLKDSTGRVFLAGGRGDGAATTWEVWDPIEGPVHNGLLNEARWNHTATLVPGTGGMGDLIYLFGGETAERVAESGEMFDAVGDTLFDGIIPLLAPTGEDPHRRQARTLHTATYLAGQGLIYIIGGYADIAKTTPLDRVDVYQVNCHPDQANGETVEVCWRQDVGFGLAEPRGGHVATEMPNNAILITGGCGDTTTGECGLETAEVILQIERRREENGQQIVTYEVNIGYTENPLWARFLHRATMLETGQLLFTGGAIEHEGKVSMVPYGELFNTP